MAQKLSDLIVCPREFTPLRENGNHLVCESGHCYPLIDGVPVMLLEEASPTNDGFRWTLEQAKGYAPPYPIYHPVNGIDTYVQEQIGSTNGHLYRRAINNLKRYPIPDLRLPDGPGKTLLDIGCNWGRWSIAAARKGYQVVGIDPSLDAVLAARRVARQLELDINYLVADARFLPFPDQSFDTVFSYSVLQHLSKENVRLALSSIKRVLKTPGLSLVQMPNRFGIRSIYKQVKQTLRRRPDYGNTGEFHVRYWTPRELLEAFQTRIGPSSLSVDGFFGLGIQKTDTDLMPAHYRAVVHGSELLRRTSKILSPLKYVADSLYIESQSLDSEVS
jgi:SAM-dependent methyltransferase/uncharacterized protein YbaR (Trm112 family)